MSRVVMSLGRFKCASSHPECRSPAPTSSGHGFRLGFLSRHRGLILVLCGFVGVSLTSGCAPPSESNHETAAPQPTAKPRIVATTHPLGFVVAYLAQDLVELELIMPLDGDPAHGSPATEQILALQSSDLVISHGVGYEQWMTTASLPESKIVRTAKDLHVVKTSGRTHSHGNQGEHSHAEVDPITWMDPTLFRQQAETVQQHLAERWPDLAAPTQDRLGSLTEQLRSIDDELEDLFAADSAAAWTFRASEPERYGYWQRKLDLQIQQDPKGGDPELLWIAPSDWESEGDRHGPTDDSCAARIDVLDQPQHPGAYDYLAQARGNLERLRAAFERCPNRSSPQAP